MFGVPFMTLPNILIAWTMWPISLSQTKVKLLCKQAEIGVRFNKHCLHQVHNAVENPGEDVTHAYCISSWTLNNSLMVDVVTRSHRLDYDARRWMLQDVLSRGVCDAASFNIITEPLCLLEHPRQQTSMVRRNWVRVVWLCEQGAMSTWPYIHECSACHTMMFDTDFRRTWHSCTWLVMCRGCRVLKGGCILPISAMHTSSYPCGSIFSTCITSITIWRQVSETHHGTVLLRDGACHPCFNPTPWPALFNHALALSSLSENSIWSNISRLVVVPLSVAESKRV